MKHLFFNLIFFVCFIATSCKNSTDSIADSVTLMPNDSICLPIDNSTYYFSKAMFQFEDSGHEYLFFLNTKSTPKIHIYNIESQELSKTIHLQREGSNGMTNIRGGYPLNLSHFIITSGNGRFWLINDTGEIDKGYNLWGEGTNFNTFDHIMYLSYIYRPAIIKDSILYFCQEALKYPRSTKDWHKIPIFAYANLSNSELGWTEFRYPPIFDKNEVFPLVYEPELSYTYTGEDTAVSFGELDSILVSSDFKQKKWYNAKSRYLPHAHPIITDTGMELDKMIQQKGMKPHYYHLMYDKYRKVFYRFALMPDDNIKPFSDTSQQAFSIVILNKQYEIIGEVKFPGNTYAYQLCFVGKKGLYISENNENNTKFDENKLVFRCFTLKKNNNEDN